MDLYGAVGGVNIENPSSEKTQKHKILINMLFIFWISIMAKEMFKENE